MRLRVLVPFVNLALVVAVFAWTKLNYEPRVHDELTGPLRDFIVKEHWPLVVAWAPFVYAMEWSSRYVPSTPRAFLYVGVAVFGLLLITSIALFWYCVVLEIDARLKGRSKLRFHNMAAEIVTLISFAITGAGALVYAYVSDRWLQPFERIRFVEILGEVFLVIWGIGLIGAFFADLRWFLRRRE